MSVGDKQIADYQWIAGRTLLHFSGNEERGSA